MGNYACCMSVAAMNSERKAIQLVHSDGNIRILRKPVTACLIMEEFPQHLVCHSDSFYIGKRTAALSESEELKVGNKYFLLPELFFQSELTLVSLASFLSSPSPTTPTAAHLRSIERASAFCQPFEIQSSETGRGRGIRVSAEFIRKLMEEERVNIDERGQTLGMDSLDGKPSLCNTPELQKDYQQLVKSRGKCWRPKLGTVKEKEKKSNFQLIFKMKRLRQT